MRILLASLLLALAATAASAECFADYKAKRDDPLRLHYGVARIDAPCDPDSARRQLRDRLADAGWELLSVEGTFDETGLEERRDSAGDHYLSY
ncbi:MAG: hypothetical protein ACU0BF_08785 [Paracoccaceae bacterium]